MTWPNRDDESWHGDEEEEEPRVHDSELTYDDMRDVTVVASNPVSRRRR